ncbi:MAG: tetratricopeptide repeat protein, partial [Alphaproteobacteria bacterium]|nr:tetratricopeptide repeat protein [Alphaproteobacteria bacterium]
EGDMIRETMTKKTITKKTMTRYMPSYRTSAIVFCAVIWAVMFAPAPFAIQGISGTDKVQAQEQDGKRRKPKTRRSQVLGKQAFNKITAAQEAITNDEHDKALNLLNDILRGDRYKPYEKGVAQQTIGFVWADKGDYERAGRAFERAINMGVLPEQVENDLIFNLAQIYLAEDQPKRSLAYLNRWLKKTDDPPASAYGLRAQIYLVLEDLGRAEKDIKVALKKSENPKESWYRVLLSILLQQERYKEALPILELVVDKFPGKKPFWQQLSAIYFERGMEEKGFAAQQAMHAQDMLTTSKELSRIAQLYLYYDYPYKAARILDEGLKNGDIEKTEKNWELLANSWMHAREWKRSRRPLLNAAQKSKGGKLYVQLGEAYIQDEDWSNAEKYLKRGIKKGKLEKRIGHAWLVLGITQNRLGKYEEAIKSFREAGEYDEVARDAFRWVRSLERRLARMRREREAKEREAQRQASES